MLLRFQEIFWTLLVIDKRYILQKQDYLKGYILQYVPTNENLLKFLRNQKSDKTENDGQNRIWLCESIRDVLEKNLFLELGYYNNKLFQFYALSFYVTKTVLVT